MSHDLDGKGPTDRALAAGYDCQADLGDGRYSYGLSENIIEMPRVQMFRGNTAIEYDRTPEEAARRMVRAWMESPGHRDNIMEAGARRIGVGVASKVRTEGKDGLGKCIGRRKTSRNASRSREVLSGSPGLDMTERR